MPWRDISVPRRSYKGLASPDALERHPCFSDHGRGGAAGMHISCPTTYECPTCPRRIVYVSFAVRSHCKKPSVPSPENALGPPLFAHSTTSAPSLYQPPTNQTHPSLQVRISPKAKPEDVATQVRGWYGAGTGMVRLGGKGAKGGWGVGLCSLRPLIAEEIQSKALVYGSG